MLGCRGGKKLCLGRHYIAVALFLAFAPLPATAQPTKATITLSNLVKTRTDLYREYNASLTSGASASDVKALMDLAQVNAANLTSKLEKSGLFSAAQIAGITGSDSTAYVDNLIASSNPSQHPELLTILDATFDSANALIDLRESQASANTVALERVRATIAARQQAWHTLFALSDPNGTESATASQTDAAPAGNNNLPTPTPNAAPAPDMAAIPQIDPATNAAPHQPPSTVAAAVPVRHGTIPNSAPDPALQVDGPRTPVAPPIRTQDPAITVPDQPEPSVPSPTGQSHAHYVSRHEDRVW